MTQEYKPDPPEQTEPEELVSRRPPSLGTGDPTPPRNSPVAAVPPPRQSPEPLPRPPSQNGSPEPPLPPTNSFGPPPTLVGCRPSPPLNCDPLPGPSNLPPIQQVPLSLKKEVDWGGGLEDKNSGESSSEYSRMPHDSVSALKGS
uniref:Uncharacterized protein n=1 Tax=Dendroctonus ponderosae TaxID=77166 RepID=A0AAR5P8F9_DENPD